MGCPHPRDVGHVIIEPNILNFYDKVIERLADTRVHVPTYMRVHLAYYTFGATSFPQVPNLDANAADGPAPATRFDFRLVQTGTAVGRPEMDSAEERRDQYFRYSSAFNGWALVFQLMTCSQFTTQATNGLLDTMTYLFVSRSTIEMVKTICESHASYYPGSCMNTRFAPVMPVSLADVNWRVREDDLDATADCYQGFYAKEPKEVP